MSGPAANRARRPRGAAVAAVLADYRRAGGLRSGPKQLAAAVAIVRRFCFQARIAGVGEITTAAVEDYLAGLLAAGRAPKTVHNHRSEIRSFCGFCRRRGLLAGNPAAESPAPKLAEKLPHYLTPAEVAAALAAARGAGCWPEIALTLATGLRRGELTRLTWADVDVGRRQLHVRIAKGRRPRTVPLSAMAIEALDAQCTISGRMRQVFPARRTWRGGGRYEDRPRSAKTWRTLTAPLQAAVPKFTAVVGTGRMFHCLRHTFASTAVAHNVGLYKLAKWLGHRDVRTVQIYAHLADNYDPDIELTVPGGEEEAALPQRAQRG